MVGSIAPRHIGHSLLRAVEQEFLDTEIGSKTERGLGSEHVPYLVLGGKCEEQRAIGDARYRKTAGEMLQGIGGDPDLVKAHARRQLSDPNRIGNEFAVAPEHTRPETRN